MASLQVGNLQSDAGDVLMQVGNLQSDAGDV